MKIPVLIVTSVLSILAAAAAFFLVPDMLGDVATAFSLDVSGDTFRLTVAMLAFVGVWGIGAVLFGRPRPERVGEEHGSARWATIRQARHFKAREDNAARPFVGRNLILSDGCALSVGSVRRRYQRNKNVFVVGGPSSGKTRYYIKANLCQLVTDFVVSDPKGLVSKGQILQTGSQPVCGTDGRAERSIPSVAKISPDAKERGKVCLTT
jgi:type IV secretion system protein VirD4